MTTKPRRLPYDRASMSVNLVEATLLRQLASVLIAGGDPRPFVRTKEFGRLAGKFTRVLAAAEAQVEARRKIDEARRVESAAVAAE